MTAKVANATCEEINRRGGIGGTAARFRGLIYAAYTEDTQCRSVPCIVRIVIIRFNNAHLHKTGLVNIFGAGPVSVMEVKRAISCALTMRIGVLCL